MITPLCNKGIYKYFCRSCSLNHHPSENIFLSQPKCPKDKTEIIYNNFSKTFYDLVKEKGVKIKIFGSRKNLRQKILEFFKG